MISYSISGLDELELKLQAVNQAINTDVMVDEAAAIMLNRLRARFLAEEGPDGKWEPSEAGVKRKAGGFTYRNGRRYSATGTLFESGTLFHSIQLYRVGAGERSIRTDVPHAKYQQHGQPPRVFLGFNEDDVNTASLLILKRVKEAING